MELPVVLGKTIDNKALVADLTKMPHLLIAGATGQGKTVGLDTIITSLLYKKRPDEMKLVLIDPKRVELNKYASIAKHFMARVGGDKEGVITNTAKAVRTLNSLCALMDHRYDLLKIAEARNIKDYNQKIANLKLNPAEGHEFMPYVVVVIDEFADLIMAAGKNFEMPLVRLAQLSRLVGIHLVIATQRPAPHIITGFIKANFPARLAYKVAAERDSITVLDGPGANQLVGHGDMLFQCLQSGSTPIRAQGAYIDEQEVRQVCHHIARQPAPIIPFMLPESENVPFSMQKQNTEQDWTNQDPLFEEAARFVVETQVASVSMLQRRYNLGFNRAGRLMEQLASANIVTSALNEVLVDDEEELKTILEQLKTKGS
jgi:S-DNA-T family DNA segregation ATPase FtsK/SpoIIIE